MATPDLPVETIVGNLAEEALVNYWKDREVKHLSQQDKYYEKYAGKNCPYRQKFVRPTITLSSLLSTVGAEKKHTGTRPITPSEYEQLATKTHVESKTSPHNPNSILHYTKGEIIVPRWPENKIKIVRDPTVSPQLPANPHNSYNVTHRPQSSPSPSERHSMVPSPKNRPRSKHGRGRSPAVPAAFSQFTEVIQDLQSKLTDEEQQAIDRIQQSLLAATRDFEAMSRSKERSPSPKTRERPLTGTAAAAAAAAAGAVTGSKLDSIKNNLANSFNSAAASSSSRPSTATAGAAPARLSPIATKVKKHYNIMEEFLDKSSSNDILFDGDFDLDFRNELNNDEASGGGWKQQNRANGRRDRPLSSVDRNGYQSLALPDFDLYHNRQHFLQQQMQWSDYANDVIAQNMQRFNAMHASNGTSAGSHEEPHLPAIGAHPAPPSVELADSFVTQTSTVAEEPAPGPSLSAAGRVIPAGLVVMTNDPLDLTLHAEKTPPESTRTLHRHHSNGTNSPKHAPAAGSAAAAAVGSTTPLHRNSTSRLTGGKSGSRRPSLENARRPSLENSTRPSLDNSNRRPSIDNSRAPTSEERRASRRSLDNAAITSPGSPKSEVVKPVRPHSASRSGPSFSAGGRRSSLSNNNNSPNQITSAAGSPGSPKSGRTSPTTPFSLTRQTPRELRKKKQHQQHGLDSPEAGLESPDSLKGEGEESNHKHGHHHHHHRHHHHHFDEPEDPNAPHEYIDATNHAPSLNPSKYQTTNSRHARKKRHGIDPADAAHSPTATELDGELKEGENELEENSQEETALEALYSVSQQVMQAVKSLNAANPVVVKPKHLLAADPYAVVNGPHDEPGDVVSMSPLHVAPHQGKANMLNMFSEMKLKTLKKSTLGAKLANVASAAATSAAASKLMSPKLAPPAPSHLDTYNEFCFDVAQLGFEIISMRDISMAKAIGRGKFAAVYEAQLRSIAKNTATGAALNSTGTLFIGPISIHHRSYNEHSETVALKIAQFEGNDPYFTPNGGSTQDTANVSNLDLFKPAGLPPLSSIIEFQRELHALRELAGHRNIVKVRGCSITPLAIAMELVEFGNLHSNMIRPEWQEETSLSDRMSYMLDICSGLMHMHSHLYVHRDIKVSCLNCDYYLTVTFS